MYYAHPLDSPSSLMDNEDKGHGEGTLYLSETEFSLGRMRFCSHAINQRRHGRSNRYTAKGIHHRLNQRDADFSSYIVDVELLDASVGSRPDRV